MKFSIIIPVRNITDHLRETIKYCKELDYPNFEIIVLPDNELNEEFDDVKFISTGNLSPPHKRDIGAEYSSGDILAFIDGDAFPKKDWLKKASKYFEDENVGAVGGPGITPDSDSFLQKASGEVYSSLLGGGKFTYRYKPQKQIEVDDFPSMNLLIRKTVFEEIGGFKTNFWPGEDTILCLNITKKLGKKIIYAPDVVVYHHRRPLFIQHLLQVYSYALYRGYFAKKYPQTSLRPFFFIPSLFVISLFAGFILSFYNIILRNLYISVLIFYFLIIIFTTLNIKNFKMKLFVITGIFLTHIVYGLGFIRGLTRVRFEQL
ncbi:MAG: glycosyltransferase [Candidatus Humimicrobiia bacterium]